MGRLVRMALGRQGEVAQTSDEEIDVDLLDARERAARAEAEVERLRRELAAKDEVLAEARKALLTARLALRDQLRLRE